MEPRTRRSSTNADTLTSGAPDERRAQAPASIIHEGNAPIVPSASAQ